jgi:hypothetical protein
MFSLYCFLFLSLSSIFISLCCSELLASQVKIGKGLQELPPVDPHLPPVVIYQQRGGTPIRALIRGLLCLFPSRAILGVVLMSSQAFFYNSIFFTYGMVCPHHHFF